MQLPLSFYRTIMTSSSWKDNGQKQFVHDPDALYRSDFFQSLGWMLKRSTWDELSPKAYWDDWLRLKENQKGRQFIRPEVCRTYKSGWGAYCKKPCSTPFDHWICHLSD